MAFEYESKSTRKQNSREAWLKRLNMYWNSSSFPRFFTRVGEIYEVDFGQNVGTEFSGRHLAVCLENTQPSQEKFLVIPITTKYAEYNVLDEDRISTKAVNVDKMITGGVVVHEACYVSKLRIFRQSSILEEEYGVVNPVKGVIMVTDAQLNRWKVL